MRTMNNKLALSPFPSMAVKTEAKGTGTVKVGYVETKVSLTPLQVMMPSGCNKYSFGDIVLVRSSHFTAPWAKEVFTAGGLQFVLAPDSVVEIQTNSRELEQ